MAQGSSSRRWLSLLTTVGPLAVLLILVAVVSIMSPDFRKTENFFIIPNQMAFVGIVAVGMTWVIILGGIDLSVGSMVAFLGGFGIIAMNAVAAKTGSDAMGMAVAAAVMLVGGPLLGLLNGGLIVVGRVAPFIVTLGTMAIFRSIILYKAEGSEIRSSVTGFERWGSGGVELPFLESSRGYPIELGYPTIVFLVVAVLAELFLRKTVPGRQILAAGGNPVAARYAGISLGRVNLLVYGFAGLTCGISALFNSSRLNSIASSSTGQLYELDAIAAVVIGGTAMSGGRGSVLGTVVGVLLLGVINNMLTMLGVEVYIQGTVKGCIIIAAVLIQRVERRAG